MNTLCRECGKPSTPEYADDHDGLCMACVHRYRECCEIVARDIVALPIKVIVSQPTDSIVDAIAVTLMSGGLADIDHDMVQPSADDPIRDAIDRAWDEYYRDVGGDS